MALNAFDLSALSLNGSAVSGTGSIAYDPALDVLSLASDGDSSERFHAVAGGSPRFEVTHMNIAAIVGLITGAPPVLALSSTGALAIARKEATDSNTFAGGTVHEQIAIALGLACLTRIGGSAGQPADCTFSIYGRSSDGDVAPVAFSAVAAPAQATALAPYILDTVTVNGVAIDDVQSAELTIEPAVRTERGPKIWPLHVAAAQNGPAVYRLRLECYDSSLIRSATAAGVEQQIVATFKNLAQGGTRGASTVTITTNAGMLIPIGRNDSSGARSSVTLEHRPRANGATAPVTIAAA